MLSQKQLETILECPVCAAVPHSTPVYQCDNGHNICNACIEKVESCPSCRSPLDGKIRNMLAEHFLEMVLTRCSYYRRGCEEKLSRAERLAHEKDCIYRDVKCPKKDCSSKTLFKSLRKHFEAQHEDEVTTVLLKYLACGEPEPLIQSLMSVFGTALTTPRHIHVGDDDDDDCSGTFTVDMYLTSKPPSLLMIDGFRIVVSYPGVLKVCFNCFARGHSKKICRNAKAPWIRYKRILKKVYGLGSEFTGLTE